LPISHIKILTEISVYVGFPRIAQDQLNKSSLNVTSQEISDPTPDNLQLVQTAVAHNPSSYHPNIDAFQGAFFMPDTQPDIIPFGYLNTPGFHATEDATIFVNETFNVTNMDQFIRYNVALYTSDTFQVGFNGRVTLHEMKFPAATVNYNQIVTLKGRQRLISVSLHFFADRNQASTTSRASTSPISRFTPSHKAMTAPTCSERC
jgi:hypothetical protein